MSVFWPKTFKEKADFGVRLGRTLHYAFLLFVAGVLIFALATNLPMIARETCGPWLDTADRWNSCVTPEERAYHQGSIAGSFAAAAIAAIIGRGMRYLVAGE